MIVVNPRFYRLSKRGTCKLRVDDWTLKQDPQTLLIKGWWTYYVNKVFPWSLRTDELNSVPRKQESDSKYGNGRDQETGSLNVG